MLLASGEAAYTWTWIFVGIFTLSGVGGIAAILRWAMNKGVDDRDDTKVREAVLGTKENGYVGMEARLITKIDDLAKEMRPNGGAAGQLGATVGRIETGLGELKSALDRQIGSNDAEHRGIRDRLDALERK